MLFDFIHPVLDSAETLAVGQIIGHDDTMSALVVAARNSLETLLASGIPDLELNSFAVDFDSSNFLQNNS